MIDFQVYLKCIIFLTQILSTRALKATLYCNNTIYESSLKEYDYYRNTKKLGNNFQ
jgi:hypothetical protein